MRYYQIDCIKVFAVFSVVAVHFLLNSGFYDIQIDSWLAYLYMLLRLIFITAVPLFIMTTGYLMGEKKLSSEYVARLFKILIVYVVVSLIDWLGQTIFLNHIMSFKDALYGLLDFSTNSYSWYVEMYIGLYLIIPILNAAWHNLSEPQYHNYIVSVAVILLFLPSLFNSGGKIISDWWTGAYPVGYYYIGLYLKTYPEKYQKLSTRFVWLSSAMIVLVLSALTLLANYHKIFAWTNENDYMGYQPMVMAILIFILLLRLPFKKKTVGNYRLLTKISSMTLTIYLFSDLSDSIIYNQFKILVPDVQHRLLFGPLVVTLSFLIATILAIIVAYVIKKFSRSSRRV